MKMSKTAYYIGTSGWSYKHWPETFFPKPFPSADWLCYYAGFFDAVEINSSFYHLPKLQTTQKWSEAVPDTFRFCVKMSRYITHVKRLKNPEVHLPIFLDNFYALLPKMGPVLIQLPPSLTFNDDVIGPFFQYIQKYYSDFAFALEFRHPSWLEQPAIDLLQQHQVAMVISNSGNRFPYSEVVTSPNVYLRYHGPEALYNSGYETSLLKQEAAKIEQWLDKGKTVWAFFNNDMGGHAYPNAIYLWEVLNNYHK